MIEYGTEKLDDVDEVNFFYTNMHFNLKLVLNPSPVHHKSVFDFQTESETLAHCHRSCPVMIRITRIHKTINAFTLLSYTLPELSSSLNH